jgi:ABC-type antimicrobial peptide transport system permease subunit
VTYIICFQVVQQKLQDQKESYRSEFSLLGDGNVDAYSLLAKIPYVSWSNVMYDSITEYEPENIQMNDVFPESSYEYWKDDEKMQIETSSMSQWFYETYIREDNNTLPTYKELVAKKQGVLCDRGNATQQGEKVTGNVFSETLPSSLKQKNGTSISLAGRGVVKDDAEVQGDTMPLLFVPDEVYLESCTPFYTIIYLNVQEGKEQEAREWFVEHKDDLDVTVGDRVTEYLEARDTSGMLQSILLAALIILAVIGIVNLSNTFAMDVQMQQKDYAIMRTLGMSRFHITRIVFAECFWYVAVGLVGSGLYTVLLLPKVLNRLLEIQLLGMGYVLLLSLKLSAFMLVFTMCMGLVFLYRQMRHGTTEILRKE